MVHAIKLHDSDNVASVFDLVEANSTVLVVDKKGNSYELKVLGKIPYGHKIAIEKIEVGQQVTKYGEEIGLATSVITLESMCMFTILRVFVGVETGQRQSQIREQQNE